MTRWTYEWEEFGGYDCMWSAYVIYLDGEEMFRVECQKGKDNPHWEDPNAEYLAKIICQRMNA